MSLKTCALLYYYLDSVFRLIKKKKEHNFSEIVSLHATSQRNVSVIRVSSDYTNKYVPPNLSALRQKQIEFARCLFSSKHLVIYSSKHQMIYTSVNRMTQASEYQMIYTTIVQHCAHRLGSQCTETHLISSHHCPLRHYFSLGFEKLQGSKKFQI